ncbi:hypothetical protein ACJRO7_027618 [Eucalyptus globulus]|uniref:Uncharacterized protein n=1 Tax=Eucalyptus globulus TaxID=34317 RepID=A0ABD3JWQ0_EUCGL
MGIGRKMLLVVSTEVYQDRPSIGKDELDQVGRLGSAEDVVIHEHDAAFEIRKREMSFGYQPFGTKDPSAFDRSRGVRGPPLKFCVPVEWARDR